MTDNTRFHLEREHDHDIEHDHYHEWVDIGTGAVYRDTLGRRHPHARRRWNILICNNTECSGRLLARADIVENDAAEWEARRLS